MTERKSNLFFLETKQLAVPPRCLYYKQNKQMTEKIESTFSKKRSSSEKLALTQSKSTTALFMLQKYGFLSCNKYGLN